jgi:hypothetical protein
MNDHRETRAVADVLSRRVDGALSALRDTIPAELHGQAVLELLRTIDSAEMVAQEKGAWPPSWRERESYGTVRALALFSLNAEEARLPSVRATVPYAEWAAEALATSGTQALVALVVASARAGLLDLRQTAPDRFEMSSIHADSGVEAAERADLDWLRERVAAGQRQADVALARNDAEILRRLKVAVRQKRDRLTSAGDPIVDAHFAEWAELLARRALGFDYFPEGERFAGLSYGAFQRGAAVLMRWALYLCSRTRVRLSERQISTSAVAARESFTLLLPRRSIVRVIARGVGTDEDQASRIAHALTMDRAFASSIHAEIPSAAVPPLVALSHQHAALSLHGCLNAPYQFMLARLRHSHPDEWRTAARATEEAFREEIYDLFASERFVCVRRPVNLNVRGGTATDLDAFILDRETGVAGLFQLKWWFAFGASMLQRSSAAKNMADGASKWRGKVDGWLSARGMRGLAEQANLSRDDRARLRRVRLFLLGRYFAHFTGQAPNDDDTARGTWPQFLRLSSTARLTESPIDALWDALRRDSPHLRTRARRTAVDLYAPGYVIAEVGRHGARSQ